MGQEVTILCLGDSLTAGSNSTNPEYPYSSEFPFFISQGIKVTNEGYPGWGSERLRNKLVSLLKERTYDVICYMAGTNDLLMTPAAEIILELEAAWKIALDKGSKVVALTVLEGRLSKDFHENQLELNKLIKRSVKKLNHERLTCFDACAALPSVDIRPDLWGDPVHPSIKGYRFLGEGVGLYLHNLLESSDTEKSKRTLFRPCIDLHSGVVKQIVGGTLNDDSAASSLKTNFVSEKPSEFYANLYKENKLEGGHVIMLGPNCTEAAKSALQAWPGSLQIGGGINDSNAQSWLDCGADKVILTSWLFPDCVFSKKRLEIISTLVTAGRLVIDLSCRLNQGKSGWTVAMNKWQTLTDLEITNATLDMLKEYCSEFLIHAADVEGLQNGVDEHLVEYLGLWAERQVPPFNITYAGGARSVADLERVNQLSRGFVDLTIGSALDIFGGSGATLDECIEWNNK